MQLIGHPLKGKGYGAPHRFPLPSCELECGWNADQLGSDTGNMLQMAKQQDKRSQAFDNLAEQSCLTSSGFAARENKFLSCINPCYFQSLKHEAQPIRTGATATSPVVLKRRSVICPKPHHETISRDIFGCHLILYLPYLFKERKKREAQSFKA